MICPYCEAPPNLDPILEDDDGNEMCADCFASGLQYVEVSNATIESKEQSDG